MKRVALHTLGCKVNFTETSTIGRQFIERDFQVVEDGQPCDVYILNTCSVTERADRECRQLIRRALRHSPSAFVIVIGCYAQLQPEEITSIEGVDLVIGASQKYEIFDLVDDFTKRSLPQVFVSCIDEVHDFNPSFSGVTDERTRAFLKVQDGCDYSCSFCTIPLARGESRSQSLREVVRQTHDLVEQGFKEIVLTGVNVGDYGKNIGTSLFELMKELECVAGLERVRISSIEPNLLTRPMVDFILQSEKFCNHFHIPLQSGSDDILRRMRRRYLTSDYRSLIAYIKSQDQQAGIGADVLVGFPGETNELFNETLLFLTELPISYLHVFTYSERPNTPAIEYADSIEPRIRAERSEVLRNLSVKKRQAFYMNALGETLPILFETSSKAESSTGLTTNYIRVETKSEQLLVNEIRRVTIRGFDENRCVGDICSQESSDSHGVRIQQTLLEFS